MTTTIITTIFVVHLLRLFCVWYTTTIAMISLSIIAMIIIAIGKIIHFSHEYQWKMNVRWQKYDAVCMNWTETEKRQTIFGLIVWLDSNRSALPEVAFWLQILESNCSALLEWSKFGCIMFLSCQAVILPGFIFHPLPDFGSLDLYADGFRKS